MQGTTLSSLSQASAPLALPSGNLRAQGIRSEGRRHILFSCYHVRSPYWFLASDARPLMRQKKYLRMIVLVVVLAAIAGWQIRREYRPPVLKAEIGRAHV